MASRHVEDAVQAYLTANWTTAPVLTENSEGETPADGSAFVRLQFPIAEVTRWAVDRRHYREEGGFRLLIAIQRGMGTGSLECGVKSLRRCSAIASSMG